MQYLSVKWHSSVVRHRSTDDLMKMSSEHGPEHQVVLKRSPSSLEFFNTQPRRSFRERFNSLQPKTKGGQWASSEQKVDRASSSSLKTAAASNKPEFRCAVFAEDGSQLYDADSALADDFHHNDQHHIAAIDDEGWITDTGDEIQNSGNSTFIRGFTRATIAETLQRKTNGIRLSLREYTANRRDDFSVISAVLRAHKEVLPDFLLKTKQEKSITIGVCEGRGLKDEYEAKRFRPNIDKPQWADLNLWSEESLSWSANHLNLKVSKKERKKQDIINELYITEKHHCQVLVILQQVYQEGLRATKLISEKMREELIPPVLDALIDFHTNLLRRLKQKRSEAEIVDSISEIIHSEFEKSERSQAAVQAFTEFCSKNDRCGRLYDEYRMKDSAIKRFFDEFEQDPAFKKRTFKMCLLLVAQRLTKYPVLLEKLSEVESSIGKEDSLRAYLSVKKFAMRVNNQITKIEVNKRWERLCSQIDQSSKGRIGQNEFFTFDDLILRDSAEIRNVICIGGAMCQNSQKKSDEGTEVIMVLFDDVLVFLANSGNRVEKYVFHDRGTGSSVIALNKLIVRDVPRTTKLFFLVADDPCYDLFVVSFATKSDVDQWKRTIEVSKEMAPKHVKRSPVIDGSFPKEDDNVEDRLGRKFSQEMSKWDLKLREIFDKRIADEKYLSDYIEKRLMWFDELQKHLRKVPRMDRTEANKNAIPEKIKSLVGPKFVELRAARRSSLLKVAERAEQLYEGNFLSFFDDAYDASAVVSASDSSPSTDQSEGEEIRQKLPRRNRTFSGIGERRRGGSNRRHTIEPQIVMDDSHAEFGDEEIRQLPLKWSALARRAAISIIKENAKLRIENNKLRSELAFRELRIASLRSRRLAATPASALEALRKRQEQLQNEKLSFQSYRDAEIEEINQWKGEIAQKQNELKAREELLQEKWEKFYEINDSDGSAQATIVRLPSASSPLPGERSSSVRSISVGQLSKSNSGSSMPLHLAEKTAKISRSKK